MYFISTASIFDLVLVWNYTCIVMEWNSACQSTAGLKWESIEYTLTGQSSVDDAILSKLQDLLTGVEFETVIKGKLS